MPALTARQRAAMAIAEHEPDKLYSRNQGMLKMTQGQLHDFAATKGLGRIKPPRQPKSLAKSVSIPSVPSLKTPT
jgi:hypothetical protein